MNAPGELNAFNRKMIEEFLEGIHKQQTTSQITDNEPKGSFFVLESCGIWCGEDFTCICHTIYQIYQYNFINDCNSIG